MKKVMDKAKLENVEWFLRFSLLERIRIARKNMQRARKLRGLALKKVREGCLTFKDLVLSDIDAQYLRCILGQGKRI